MIERPHVTVAAVVEQAGRFLLVEEIDNGTLCLNQPAGHLEAGESLLAGVARETLEETGHRIEPLAVLGLYHWYAAATGRTYVRVAYIGRVLDHDPQRALDKEIVQALWLSAEEIKQQRARHRNPLVERCVNDYLAGIRYPLALIQNFI